MEDIILEIIELKKRVKKIYIWNWYVWKEFVSYYR